MVVVGCSSGEATPAAGQGGLGSGGSDHGGVLGSGGQSVTGGTSGASNTGGERAFGGAVNSGGTPAATGGSVAGAGAAGTSAGGKQSTGGATTGGALAGGATSGGSGGATSTGGVAASGGQNGGRSGAGGGGNSGVGGGAGTAGATSDTTLAGEFDGALITYPCGAAHSGFDCDNVGCSNGQVTHATPFRFGGDSGVVYDVSFRVRGIVEAYNYVGGTRDSGNATISSNPDLFLRGGSAQPAGANGYDYDVYELDVSPAVSGAPNTYFLNSVTSTENPHTSSATLHLSFAIDYTKTIRVPGGGTITVKQFDSNCKSVMNCGKTSGSTCAAPRSVSLAEATPAAPATFMQPYQMPAGAYGQWLFFDVTSVVVAP
jgi:hypothetical protein